MQEIIDIDQLKPPKRLVKIDGKTYDIGFIPIGVALDIESDRNDLAKFAENKIEVGSKESEEASRITLSIIAKILYVQDETITEDWVKDNLTTGQALALTEIIYESLQRSMISAFPKEEDDSEGNPTKAER